MAGFDAPADNPDDGIIRRYRVNTTARGIDFFLDNVPGDPRFDMDQPYQRGVVWGVIRKRNLIKSILMGIPIPAIVLNDRFAAKFTHPGYSRDREWMYAIVDGKQRVTAVQQFVRGGFDVPAWWFGNMYPAGGIRFPELDIAHQWGFRNTPLPVAEGQFKTLHQERELFDLVNFGGLAQGEVDADV